MGRTQATEWRTNSLPSDKARQMIGASVQTAGRQASSNGEREEVKTPNGEQSIKKMAALVKSWCASGLIGV